MAGSRPTQGPQAGVVNESNLCVSFQILFLNEVKHWNPKLPKDPGQVSEESPRACEQQSQKYLVLVLGLEFTLSPDQNTPPDCSDQTARHWGSWAQYKYVFCVHLKYLQLV